MTALTIPLAGYPETFTIALGGVSYTLTIQYRNGWFMDIADDSGSPIASSIPMVVGIDLLSQYGYLGIPGPMILVNTVAPNVDPDYTNLGTDVILTYGT